MTEQEIKSVFEVLRLETEEQRQEVLRFEPTQGSEQTIEIRVITNTGSEPGMAPSSYAQS